MWFCRRQVTKYDFSEIPFMSTIELLFNSYMNLDKKQADLQNMNEKLKKKLISNRCNKHNGEFLYYCIDCDEKLCGKCTSFINKESKIHEKHKVFDYSEIEKSPYINIINLLENTQKQMKIIDNNLKRCEEIKQNNSIKLKKKK